MFLGVSDTVLHVEMNERQRYLFGRWLKGVQRSRYGGSAQAAYTAAQVNSATWARVTNGQSVKPLTVTKLLNAFLPEAGGDWQAVTFIESTGATVSARVETVGGDAQDARRNETDFVEAPGVKVESGITNEDLLREILRSRAEYDQIRAEVRDLSGRMDRLEQSDS